MQSEAVSGAYRAWRRDWKGKGKQYVSLLGPDIALIIDSISYFVVISLVRRRHSVATQ
jgi:hypothetical protein